MLMLTNLVCFPGRISLRHWEHFGGEVRVSDDSFDTVHRWDLFLRSRHQFMLEAEHGELK